MDNQYPPPVPYRPSGYELGEYDSIHSNSEAHELMVEKTTDDVPDSLVIIIVHVLNETNARVRLLLEHAPVGQRFPVVTDRWEMCDHIRYAIEENIRLNKALFPELDDFSFSTVRTNTALPQGRVDFNHSSFIKLGFRYKSTPKVEDVCLRVDPQLKNFPVVVRDAFVRDVGGMISQFFNMSGEGGADIAREAMLLGEKLVLKDLTQIVEARVTNIKDRMHQTTRYGGFCDFIRSQNNHL